MCNINAYVLSVDGTYWHTMSFLQDAVHALASYGPRNVLSFNVQGNVAHSLDGNSVT